LINQLVWKNVVGYAYDTIKIRCAFSPWKAWLANTIVGIAGLILRLFRIDECIYFNNWLVSTNLWPNTIQWSSEQVQEINKALLTCSASCLASPRPTKAILWRSIDALSQPELFKRLSATPSCLLVPSRVVNWIDLTNVESLTTQFQNLKKDLRLFQSEVGWNIPLQKQVNESTIYELAIIAPEKMTMDLAVQAVDLYHQLSTKYSCRNPQITPTGLFRLIRNQTMTLEVLRIRAGSSSGRLVGMSAWTSVDGIPTSCFGGYDVSSKDRNLYRLGWLMCYNQSIRTGMVQQHLSAGANKFKRHRGATSTMEYTAVFVDHLPLYRQWGWKIVKAVTDKVITVERAS
jgi:hypothetical protein